MTVKSTWRLTVSGGGGDGYLPMAYGNRREALLAVLAHEMRHLWQASHARGRVWGSRGRMSERDADAAIRYLCYHTCSSWLPITSTKATESIVKETSLDYLLGATLAIGVDRWRVLEIDPGRDRVRVLLVANPLQRGVFGWREVQAAIVESRITVE